jgi:2',3'-cyclic-nucleotide 2'-phosphodiesterase (5'-nucleotidase family)
MKYNRYFFLLLLSLIYTGIAQTGSTDSTTIKWNAVIGHTNVELNRSLWGESLIHNLICDLLIDRIPADICILDYNSVHDALPAGEIRELDMFRLFPFKREIVTFTIKGNQLKEIVEFKLSGLRSGLMLGGARIEYDTTRANNSRLTYFEIGGFNFYPEKVYRVVTISYLAQGNSGFDLMRTIPYNSFYYTGLYLRDVIAEQITKFSPIAIKPDGRRKLD